MDCCCGRLEVFDAAGSVVDTLYTIEKPWVPSTEGGLGGEPFRSCVAPGQYRLAPFRRPNGDHVWILENHELDVFELDSDIPSSRRGLARYLILIHIANYARDVVGCIGPGMGKRRNRNGTLMVTRSKDAMAALHRWLDGKRNLHVDIAQGWPAGPTER